MFFKKWKPKKKTKKYFKTLNIEGIYLLNGKLFEKSTIMINNQKKMFLLINKIWDLDPKILFEYYENHINYNNAKWNYYFTFIISLLVYD